MSKQAFDVPDVFGGDSAPTRDSPFCGQTEQALAECQTRLRLLHALAQHASTPLSEQEIIALTLKLLHETFPDLRAVYSTLDSDSQLTLSASVGPSTMASLSGQTLDLAPVGEYREALRFRGPVVVADIASEASFACVGAALAATGCMALLDVCCHCDFKTWGVLSLHAPHPHAWTAFERQTLEDVAGHAALLLQNARLQVEWQQAERARRKANKRVANILDSITDAFLSVDRDWHITYVNTQAESLLRRAKQELVGRTLWEAFPHAGSYQVHDQLHWAMSKQTTVQFEDFYPVSGRWLEHSAYPSQDGLSVYTRDITPRKRAEEDLRQGIESLQRSVNGIVQAMSFAVEIRDPYTAGHQRRVSVLAARMAGKMGLDAQHVEAIRIAGLLHDIGKIAIPAEILSRPGPLTFAELSIIHTHAEVGYNILKDIEFTAPVALVALQHHERLDGSGYPNGLKGDEILLEARIIAVADVVEAMGSHRPYRPAVGVEKALAEIMEHKGTRYDTQAVAACFELFRANGFDLEQVLEG